MIEFRRWERTLLAVFFAVILSLMFAPQLVWRTIFVAVLFALIVNIPWRWKKDGRD